MGNVDVVKADEEVTPCAVASFSVNFSEVEASEVCRRVWPTGSEDILADRLEVCDPCAWVASHQEGAGLVNVWGEAIDVKCLSESAVRQANRVRSIQREAVDSDSEFCAAFLRPSNGKLRVCAGQKFVYRG